MEIRSVAALLFSLGLARWPSRANHNFQIDSDGPKLYDNFSLCPMLSPTTAPLGTRHVTTSRL